MLNEAQKKVIKEINNPLMVISSAGSGKSSSITNKIAKLLMEGKINIIAITFTKNTRLDLQKKIFKLKIKDSNGNLIDIKTRVKIETFHSLCRRIMLIEGLKADNLIIPYEVENVLRKVRPKEEDLDLKDVLSFIGYQKNHMKSCEDEFVEKESNYFIDELRDFYRAYSNYQKENERYDFDDYLLEGYKILKNTKDKYICNYLLLDEAQDCNEVQMKIVDLLCPSHMVTIVGDYQQCLLPQTKIRTSQGLKEIQNIKVDDEIIVGNGRGMTTITKPTEILCKEYNGNVIKIKTKNGNELTCTPNHMIFVNKKINKPYYVYLMYRENYGFRIGMSKSYDNKERYDNGFEGRMVSEKASKVWCLATCKDEGEVRYFENYYSYKYGIPQIPFECDNRHMKISDEMSKKLFNELNSYERGLNLLKDLDMYFEYPHYHMKGNSNLVDIKIQLCMFGSHTICKGKQIKLNGHAHELSYCTTDESFIEESKGIDIRVTKRKNGQGRKYIKGRKTNGDIDSLYKTGVKLESLRKRNLFEIFAKISKENTKMVLFPASNIREGMKLAIYKNNEIIEDEVEQVTVNEYNGLVYDINVDTYRNYVAEDIIVHNCIFSFRGANPELFMNLYNRYDNTKIINMNINYRSDKLIVDRSNYFIRQYYGSYKYYKDAISNSSNDGFIELIKNDCEEDESFEICDKIQTLLGLGHMGKDIAVLYRNNIQSQTLEGELRKRGIHYFIDSDTSFFNRKEIDMVMCILRLIKDNSDNSAYDKIFKYKCLPLNMLKNELLNNIAVISKNENKNFLDSSIEVSTDLWRRNKLKNFHSYIKRLSAKYLSGANLDTLLNDIINLFSFEEYIKSQHSNDEDRVEKLKSLENLKKIAKGLTLEQLLKLSYEGGNINKKPSENDIRLMTAHKSKGLEFKNVIIIGVEQGKFPSDKSSEIEEARLFYVAITRAKNNMIISQIGIHNKFIEQYFGNKDYRKRLEECV